MGRRKGIALGYPDAAGWYSGPPLPSELEKYKGFWLVENPESEVVQVSYKALERVMKAGGKCKPLTISMADRVKNLPTLGGCVLLKDVLAILEG